MPILTELAEVVLVPLKKKKLKKNPWLSESDFTVSFGKKDEFITVDAKGNLEYFDGQNFHNEEVSVLFSKADAAHILLTDEVNPQVLKQILKSKGTETAF